MCIYIRTYITYKYTRTTTHTCIYKEEDQTYNGFGDGNYEVEKRYFGRR